MAEPQTEIAPTSHYLYVNMRDIGCNCGVRFRGVVGKAERDAAFAVHMAEVETDETLDAAAEYAARCREDYVRVSNDDGGVWTFSETCPRRGNPPE